MQLVMGGAHLAASIVLAVIATYCALNFAIRMSQCPSRAASNRHKEILPMACHVVCGVTIRVN